jgi:hypothetical protein
VALSVERKRLTNTPVCGVVAVVKCGATTSSRRATNKEVLARNDIDAMIIGTPDLWHKQVSFDAMRAGKDCLLREAHHPRLPRRP